MSDGEPPVPMQELVAAVQAAGDAMPHILPSMFAKNTAAGAFVTQVRMLHALGKSSDRDDYDSIPDQRSDKRDQRKTESAKPTDLPTLQFQGTLLRVILTSVCNTCGRRHPGDSSCCWYLLQIGQLSIFRRDLENCKKNTGARSSGHSLKRSQTQSGRVFALTQDSQPILQVPSTGALFNKPDCFRNFRTYFPEELPRIPPIRDVEFNIELIPEAEPISKAPYRMAPIELKELKDQLQELLERARNFYDPQVEAITKWQTDVCDRSGFQIYSDASNSKKAVKSIWAIIQNINQQTEFCIDDDGILWQGTKLCVPEDPTLREALMTEAHSSPFSIHPVKLNTQRAMELLQPLEIPYWKWDEISMEFVVSGTTDSDKAHAS
ncbi:hypothetical protein Tco_1068928 [Tanacetum coccineum]|uniref:Uncharacterized protein n=1 Tax=Tanacetum coccineum TaxID=301880 RepID=A0ABQ5HH17_9ASTR